MNFTKKTKGFIIAFFLICMFVGWTVLITRIPATELVNLIGVGNGYLLTFFVAFLGGTSLFFPLPYYLLVFTFAAGGLNPFYLGIFAGTGLALGDSTSYLLGYLGREAISSGLLEKFNKFYNWISKKPSWAIYSMLFLYGSFVPVSDDVIVVPLGIVKYPYLKVIIPLWMGNIVYNTIIAFAGIYGFHWIGL
jgi:membrane protein DedA with SNARE-associated domain